MNLLFKEKRRGIGLKINYNKFSDDFILQYPKKIWKSYPRQAKNALIDNIANCNTIAMPLVAEIKKINYNTSMPGLKSFFEKIVKKEIPQSVDSYDQDADYLLNKFSKINFTFKDQKTKESNYDKELSEKALLPLSCGKDSLLTLGLSMELGLNPTCVYINDTVSPTENKIKLKHTKVLSKKNKFPLIHIKNEIEQANDFEYWNKDETCVGYAHMIMGFNLISLPVAHFYDSKYIILGNQQDMNFSFKSKDGYKTYPCWSQTTKGMKLINNALQKFTNKKVNHFSLIESLANIAITKILHKRYQNLGKYQISCDCLNASNEKRWCHDCSKCARLTLFKLAVGVNPKTVGMKNNMLDKKYRHCYSLFSGSEQDQYEKSKEAIEQQMFAFYLAYKNGIRGGMIELFKKKFLAEAKAREDEFRKKFFKIYPGKTIPKKLKKPLLSIYKEELKPLQ